MHDMPQSVNWTLGMAPIATVLHFIVFSFSHEKSAKILKIHVSI